MQVNFDESFDIVIIGGGAIGSNIALYASLFGLKTLLIEQNDFSSAASSKSTKLLHGGVRYLESAVNNLDKRQIHLVNEALNERYYFLNNANFLSKKLSIITPVKNWYKIPYYYSGLKIYDFISGNKSLGNTTYLSKKDLNKTASCLKSDIKHGIRFYDGSFNDSKLNISILQTAKKNNAQVRNYHQLNAFIYKDEKIVGLRVFNKVENKEYFVKSNCIINATGHYIDQIRKLDNENAKSITQFSKGSHIVVSNEKLQLKEGIIIPKTSDGRVLFALPWQNHILIGTTDISCDFKDNLSTTKEEKEYLLKHLNLYFNIKIKMEDILSSWTGIRTLLKEGTNTKDIVREHIFEKSKTNLISIAGGKWTTSRKIAHECLEFLLKHNLIENKTNFSLNNDIKLYGCYEDINHIKKTLSNKKISNELLNLLIENYGSQSYKVLEIADKYNAYEKINEDLPYIKAEILYSIENEFVIKPMDFLARRLRLAFLDKKLCKKCLEYVTITLCEHFNYDKTKYNNLLNESKKELDAFF